MQDAERDKWSYLPPLLALPIILVIVLVATGGPLVSVSESEPVSPFEKHAMRRTRALLAGLPQHGSALGNPKAPVTLQFFGDLQCVNSRRVMLGALPVLIRHWVRDGKLRLVYRSTQSDTVGSSEFFPQQIAALAAGQQGKMWTFVDLFYREQRREFTRYADDAFLEGIAQQADVDLRAWAEDRAARGWAGQIEFEEALAEDKALDDTPSFLIGPTGGKTHVLRHFSLEEPKAFNEAIKELL